MDRGVTRGGLDMTQRIPPRRTMHYQSRTPDLELGVAVVADDLKAALLRAFLAVSHAPSDPGVQRLLDDIKRDRVKPHEHLARILVCAHKDGARPADVTAIATKVLAFFGDDDAPPAPKLLRTLSVEEERASAPLNLMQAEGLDVLTCSESQLHAAEEACERQERATRALRRCLTAARVSRAQQRGQTMRRAS